MHILQKSKTSALTSAAESRSCCFFSVSRLSQLLKPSKNCQNNNFTLCKTSFFTAALFLFQSHSGGAHPVLLTAERSHSGGGGAGGRGHAGGPRAASQERWRGPEPLRCSVFVKESWEIWPSLLFFLNSFLSHTLQGACRGSCQLPWRLLADQRSWYWTNPPLELTPIPGDPFGTSCWNIELVKMCHLSH